MRIMPNIQYKINIYIYKKTYIVDLGTNACNPTSVKLNRPNRKRRLIRKMNNGAHKHATRNPPLFSILCCPKYTLYEILSELILWCRRNDHLAQAEWIVVQTITRQKSQNTRMMSSFSELQADYLVAFQVGWWSARQNQQPMENGEIYFQTTVSLMEFEI